MVIPLFSAKGQFKQQAQQQKAKQTLFADVLWFQSDSAELARVDVFTMIPFQALQFMPAQKGFQSRYSLYLTIRDTTGKKVAEKTIENVLSAETYEQSRGANAEFDYNQQSFLLAKGYYTIFISLRDQIGQTELQQIRTITIPSLLSVHDNQSEYVLSSIMFCSSIEEQAKGKTIITPHISNNVAELSDGFFLFFELYHRGKLSDDNLGISYTITDEDEEEVFLSSKPVQYGAGRAQVQQIYMPIKQTATLKPDTYTITVKANDWKNNDSIGKERASTKRTLLIEKTIGGLVYNNLDKAIRQLRFVATQGEIDKIQDGNDEETRKVLFEEFWKALDPTPATSRNEAFEEYYGRIDYANTNFRSYTEGWMTDMGMVYIIFGQPIQFDKTPRGSDGRSYARWIYPDQRQFTFVDNSGFEDFRLTTPFPSGIKYRFRGQ